MEKLKGTLHHSDLEGGVWIFRSEDGRQFSLDGLPKQLQVDGAHLELEGQEAQAMGFAMVGSVFQVRSARLAG